MTDVGDYFEEARAVSNKRIVVAAGDKGAYIYNYDISSKKVTFVKNFSLTDDSSNNLDIDDIIFDDDHNLVYVLDK